MLTYTETTFGGAIHGAGHDLSGFRNRRKNDQDRQKSGISKSKWIAALIREKTASTWPDHIFGLAGAWKDFPTAEEIRESMGHDGKREPL